MVKLWIALILALAPSFSTANEMRGPIVCIHGHMRTHRSMDDMAVTFKRGGWPVVKWSYHGPDYCIKEHGEHLAIALREIACANPGQPISFITHSLGGLVLRAAINDPNCPQEARCGRAVLLACPNQGSRFGRRMGRIPFVRAILRRGAGLELITEENFNYLGEYPPTMEVLVIAGSRDAKVRPDETALTTPYWYATGPYFHTWISNQPDVISLTCTFIQGECCCGWD